MATVLIPLAEGVEEIEAVILIDVFRRAGWRVVAAGLTPSPILASRGVRLMADVDWDKVPALDFDAFVLPGGLGGTQALMNSPSVLETIRRYHAAGKLVAALCAAPLVLQAAGILKGRRATCHPGAAAEMTVTPALPDRVVIDGNVITSQGPGTAFEFALAIIAHLEGEAAVAQVAPGLILPCPRQ